MVLRALHAAGAGEATRVLAARAASGVSLEDVSEVASLLKALRAADTDDALQILLDRDPAGQTGAESAWDVTELLDALRALGADQAVATLAARGAAQASLDDAEALARLLDGLRGAGAATRSKPCWPAIRPVTPTYGTRGASDA